jgi:hypothetical protein
MDEETQTLDKDKILSTPARRKLFQARMEGKNIRQAAEIAEIGYNYARELCAGLARHSMTDLGINALVKAEQEKIEAKTAETYKVTVERVLRELEETRQAAYEKGEYSTVARCVELKGKHLAMFTDRSITEGTDTPELTAQREQAARELAEELLKRQHSPNLSENRQSMINAAQVHRDTRLTIEAKQGQEAEHSDIQDIVGAETDEPR